MDEGEAQLFSNEPHSDQHITLLMGAGEGTDAEEVPTSSEELNKLYRTQCQLRSILPKQSIEIIRKPSPNIEQILSTFNYETHRRKTFNAWPKSTIVSPRELAASGFIYIHGTDDTVECFYCKLKISDWTNSMVPDVVHRKKSMHCQFMQGVKTVRNIPDVLADIFNDDALPLPSTETELGIITESTKHPEFAVDSRRKDTFLTWPSGNSKLASEMIEHQLFYPGRGDVVCCFSCGVEMADWAPTDNVWRRHARQSPECQLVIQEKGADWIAATIQEHGRYVEPEKEPVIHSVTTRMLRPRMDNTATQNVLQMISPDYPREEVRSALIQNIKFGGPDFMDRASIVRAMLKRREDARQLDAVQRAIASEPAPPEVVTPPQGPGDQEEAATQSTVQPPAATAEEPSTSRAMSPPPEEEPMESAEAEAPSGPGQSGNEPETPQASTMDLARIVKSQLTCKICMDGPVGIAFLPCGHMVCCPSCAPAMLQCPLCRQDVRGTVRVYLDKL
ncbi:baculoviral IAP repeat-containing protein 7-like [Watersipora subatra]|uniref:baculoviral IAP repeat-containing protein 7-like n=1 Tax=Watersipora subatra TaxID=2589382 RepID=UPI00355BC023